LFFSSDPPAEIVQLALRKKFQLVLSDFILEEVERNSLGKFQVTKRKASHLIYRIAQVADIYNPTGTVKVIKDRNPDNLVLETAHMGRARYLVTGDRKHLLPLKSYRMVRIIEANHFLVLLKGK
jgi:putative PIN family toxin of toxin-antitoxin system